MAHLANEQTVIFYDDAKTIDADDSSDIGGDSAGADSGAVYRRNRTNRGSRGIGGGGGGGGGGGDAYAYDYDGSSGDVWLDDGDDGDDGGDVDTAAVIAFLTRKHSVK
jgi:hypothetical protein